MTRQSLDPQPGVVAKYAAECPRCGDLVERGARVAFQRGRYIHVECASGADDR